MNGYHMSMLIFMNKDTTSLIIFRQQLNHSMKLLQIGKENFRSELEKIMQSTLTKKVGYISRKKFLIYYTQAMVIPIPCITAQLA